MYLKPGHTKNYYFEYTIYTKKFMYGYWNCRDHSAHRAQGDLGSDWRNERGSNCSRALWVKLRQCSSLRRWLRPRDSKQFVRKWRRVVELRWDNRPARLAALLQKTTIQVSKQLLALWRIVEELKASLRSWAAHLDHRTLIIERIKLIRIHNFLKFVWIKKTTPFQFLIKQMKSLSLKKNSF